jgi:hypothetical protein
MNTPPGRPETGRRSTDEGAVDRTDLELDVVFALEPLDEALDVAFAAVKGPQQSVRSIPDTAAASTFRNEWRTHNVLVRQARRLVGERVQELTKAIKRLPRVG